MSIEINFRAQKPVVQTSFFHTQANRDIQFEIFAYLPAQDLVSCCKVCHLFYDVTNIDNFAEQKTLWTRLFKQHFPNAIAPKHITKKEFEELALFEKRLKQGLCLSSVETINSKHKIDPCYANITPDGKVILAYENGLIRICDPIENTCIELISENQECPREISLSPSQVLCSYDSRVAVWDIQKRKYVNNFELPTLFFFNKPSFTGVIIEDQIILRTNQGFEVRDLETADVVFSDHQAHQKSIIKILPLKNGRFVTLSSDETLKIWDIQQKKCTQTISPAYRGVPGPILFETKMGQIFFLSRNHQPCLLDPKTGNQTLFTEDGAPINISSSVIDAYEINGRILMKTSGILYVLDLQTHRTTSIEEWANISYSDFSNRHFLFTPSDKLMSIAHDGTVSLLDLQTKKNICSVQYPNLTRVTKFTLTKDQKILALRRTDDANIQSLVTLTFTDSTINILKDLANKFDATAQYYEVLIALEAFLSNNQEFTSKLHSKIWLEQPDRYSTKNDFANTTFTNASPKQKAYYLEAIQDLPAELKDQVCEFIKKLDELSNGPKPIHYNDQFARLSPQDQKAIYEHLYFEIGERICVKVTDQQKAQAIRNYALELEKKFPSQNVATAKKPRIVSIREFTPPIPAVAKKKLVKGQKIDAPECLSVIGLILPKDYSDALNVRIPFLKQVGISSSKDLQVMGIAFDLLFTIDDFSEELPYLCQENTSVAARHQSKEHIAALTSYVEQIQNTFSQKLMTILDIANRLGFHEIMNTDGFKAIAEQLEEIRKNLEMAGSSPQTANAFNSEKMKAKLSEILTTTKKLEKQRLKMMLKAYLKRPYLIDIWSDLRNTRGPKVTLETHHEKPSIEKCYNL